MRQLVYIMFVTNNHASFHLRWKVFFRFLCLLTALIVRNSHILPGNYFYLSKQTSYTFNTKFGPQWKKDRESIYQVRQILARFCISVALIVGLNWIKGLRVTKIVKQIKFEGVSGELEVQKLFAETTIHKVLETNSSLLETNSSFYVK